MSRGAKHDQATVDIDEYLRSHYSPGARVALQYKDFAATCGLPYTAQQCSAALLELASIRGTGLTRDKAGHYTYVYSAEPYPKELQALKKSLRHPNSLPRRTKLMEEVHVWLKAHPGFVSVSECAEDLEAKVNSVSACLLRFKDVGVLEPKPELGLGFYFNKPLDTLDTQDELETASRGSETAPESETAASGPVAEDEQPVQRLVDELTFSKLLDERAASKSIQNGPTPADMPSHTLKWPAPGLFKVIGTTERTGRILIEDHNGKPGFFEPLTKEDK